MRTRTWADTEEKPEYKLDRRRIAPIAGKSDLLSDDNREYVVVTKREKRIVGK